MKLDLKGGAPRVIATARVDLDIFIDFFGIKADFNLNFCIPISISCLFELVAYGFEWIKCAFTCCETDDGIFRRALGNFLTYHILQCINNQTVKCV